MPLKGFSYARLRAVRGAQTISGARCSSIYSYTIKRPQYVGLTIILRKKRKRGVNDYISYGNSAYIVYICFINFHWSHALCVVIS